MRRPGCRGGDWSLRSARVGCLVCIVGVVVAGVGMRVPALLIEPGTDNFEGEERRLVVAFYSYEVWRKFGEGPGAYMVTGARVTEVSRCPGAPPYDPRSTYPYGTEISGTIRVHTIFGLPYRSIGATCGRVAAG